MSKRHTEQRASLGVTEWATARRSQRERHVWGDLWNTVHTMSSELYQNLKQSKKISHRKINWCHKSLIVCMIFGYWFPHWSFREKWSTLSWQSSESSQISVDIGQTPSKGSYGIIHDLLSGRGYSGLHQTVTKMITYVSYILGNSEN